MYSSFGIRKIVSTVASSLRFISAIWNSNSKSETARKPRMTARAFCCIGEFDQQSIERRDPHVVDAADGFLEKSEPLLESEERLLLVVMRDGHDHFVEKLSGALDYIEVTVGDRIEAAGINRASHSGKYVTGKCRHRKRRNQHAERCLRVAELPTKQEDRIFRLMIEPFTLPIRSPWPALFRRGLCRCFPKPNEFATVSVRN